MAIDPTAVVNCLRENITSFCEVNLFGVVTCAWQLSLSRIAVKFKHLDVIYFCTLPSSFTKTKTQQYLRANNWAGWLATVLAILTTCFSLLVYPVNMEEKEKKNIQQFSDYSTPWRPCILMIRVRILEKKELMSLCQCVLRQVLKCVVMFTGWCGRSNRGW